MQPCLWLIQIQEHSILASGVRNSFDGAWIVDIGYVFTDNGRTGRKRLEELNLLEIGADYGWPNDIPDDPAIQRHTRTYCHFHPSIRPTPSL